MSTKNSHFAIVFSQALSCHHLDGIPARAIYCGGQVHVERGEDEFVIGSDRYLVLALFLGSVGEGVLW